VDKRKPNGQDLGITQHLNKRLRAFAAPFFRISREKNPLVHKDAKEMDISFILLMVEVTRF
jgi:hypothetical protein